MMSIAHGIFSEPIPSNLGYKLNANLFDNTIHQTGCRPEGPRLAVGGTKHPWLMYDIRNYYDASLFLIPFCSKDSMKSSHPDNITIASRLQEGKSHSEKYIK